METKMICTEVIKKKQSFSSNFEIVCYSGKNASQTQKSEFYTNWNTNLFSLLVK